MTLKPTLSQILYERILARMSSLRKRRKTVAQAAGQIKEVGL
jgi:hypothetical protein